MWPPTPTACPLIAVAVVPSHSNLYVATSQVCFRLFFKVAPQLLQERVRVVWLNDNKVWLGNCR